MMIVRNKYLSKSELLENLLSKEVVDLFKTPPANLNRGALDKWNELGGVDLEWFLSEVQFEKEDGVQFGHFTKGIWTGKGQMKGGVRHGLV